MLPLYLATIETQKDRDLFSSLYTEYKGFMFNIANRVLNDRHAAEDIVHDAFVRIIENMGKISLRNGHKTKGLVGIIVDGLAKDEYRRRKRLSSLDDEVDDVHAVSINIEEQSVRLEDYENLKKHIRQLDAIYSNALLLRYEYGYSIKEIAQIVNVQETTVRQRLHRARLKLRKLLVEDVQTV